MEDVLTDPSLSLTDAVVWKFKQWWWNDNELGLPDLYEECPPPLPGFSFWNNEIGTLKFETPFIPRRFRCWKGLLSP